MPNCAPLPPFFAQLPEVDVGLDGVTARALRGSVLCMVLHFDRDVHVPVHSHGGQFGLVLSGSLRMRRAGKMSSYQAGDSYSIGAGEEHEAWIQANSTLIEFFEDADRY